MTTNIKYSMPDRPSPGTTMPAHPIGKIKEGCYKSTTGLNNILTQQKNNSAKDKGVGKIQELTSVLYRYRWDIIGLAETQWKNSGEIITHEEIVYSGQDKYHQ